MVTGIAQAQEGTPAAGTQDDASLAGAAPALAQMPMPMPTPTPRPMAIPEPLPVPYLPEKGAIEFVFGDGRMTNGYGSATAAALRGMVVTSLGVIQGELDHQSRFGFSGQYGALSLTRVLSEDYYMTVGAGTGSSELFPTWRVDVSGYRKLGPDRRFVLGLGAYYAKGRDSGRSDDGVLLSGIGYFSSMVIEGGLRFNRANPGQVFGPSQYIAATFGSDEKRAFIVRAEHAREAYQVLTTGTERVNYDSQSFSIQWRERINSALLLLLGVQYYHNPNYSRTTADLGFRWSFR
jgi:YaiO family outer membrane protein